MIIGIPRALFYYQYFPFCKVFFESLGHKIVCSPPTNRNILKKGIELCVDDACLPVKVFHGHVAYLVDKAEVVYIPRIVSIAPKEYICPKFLGLPDMIKNSIQGLPPIIETDINLYKGKNSFFRQVFKLGHLFNKNNIQILSAYSKSIRVQKQFEKQLIKNKIIPGDLLTKAPYFKYDAKQDNEGNNRLTILLLGHYYNIYDDYISMNLTTKLRKQSINFITTEMVTDETISIGNKNLSKNMFWTLGKKTLGTAYYYLENSNVDGIIYVASFGCGPDSLVGELVEKRATRDFGIPFLLMYLDEHSGEAGFNTRLEAFLDVLEGRKQHENYISTYG